MEKVFEDMLNYLRNASKEELAKDWEYLKKYNKYGPKADEVIELALRNSKKNY